MSARLACSGMGCYGMEADPLGDYVSHADYAALRAERDALADALRRLEVSANTVAYCYEKRAENFAAALRDMEADAEAARAALALMKAAAPQDFVASTLTTNDSL